jgi:hypothetical protein
MDVGQDRRGLPAFHQAARLSSGRWPARAQRLLEASYKLCVDGLHEPLRQCLGDFEQQLFAQAERARQHTQQQDYFSSRQRVLQDRAQFEQRFNEQIATAFNALDDAATPATATANANATGKTDWQSLELLDPVAQELIAAVDQLGARGEVRHSGVLYELGYRLAVLISAPPLEGIKLPLGPHALAEAFHQASTELELPLAHQLMLLQSFDHWVIQPLAHLYDAINAQLQDDGILPQLRSIPIPRHISSQQSRPGKKKEAAAAVTSETPHHNEGAASSQGGSIEVLESLRDLLAQQRVNQGGVAGQPAGLVAGPEELQTALSALQQHLAQVTDHASRELRSAARLREELLIQLNVGKPSDAPRTHLSNEQGDTVELVAMLFEQLGQQLQQGGNARALLGDMQLPVLRMAVADKDFFEKREHPARKLLETVTAAANDWLDGSDDESNRPLANKLEQLVARASQEPPSAGLYTTLLADIEHHLGLLTRKAQAAERRHVEAAQGRERLDQARHRAGQLMAERFAQSPPRGLLRALLDRAWSDVLALTLLRHGEDSEAFGKQLAITDQLLGRLPIDDRQQLQQNVENGLQQIGMHAEEAEQVAQRLLGTDKPDAAVALPSATDLAMRLKQHQRLGEHQSTQPTAPTPPVPTAPPIPFIPSTKHEPAAAHPIQGAHGKQSAHPAQAPEPSPRERRIEQHLGKLPFGSWFEFVDPTTGQIARRKLAWHSPMSGRCLLVSRRGQRGEEMTLTQLAHEIAAGRVCEVPEQRESMLDRAWRSLTGNLRQSADKRLAATQEPDRR